MKKALFVFIFLPVFLFLLLFVTYKRNIRLVFADKQQVQDMVVPVPFVADKVATEPARLVIPEIHVDALVERVGLDKSGNMDVPSSNNTTGWYDLGYRPGEKGNTVIDGHLDTKTGEPAVFYHLSELERGDIMILYDRNDVKFTYQVTKVQEYPYDLFPLKDVFGSYMINRLILITCQGVFDNAAKNYSHRTVVFSDLVTSQ
jgi:LPXTG-site transpeptidase (sortase) family protein